MSPRHPGSFEHTPRWRTGFDAADRTGEALAALARRERALAAAEFARRRGATAPVTPPAPGGWALRAASVPAGVLGAIRAAAQRGLDRLARPATVQERSSGDGIGA